MKGCARLIASWALVLVGGFLAHGQSVKGLGVLQYDQTARRLHDRAFIWGMAGVAAVMMLGYFYSAFFDRRSD